MPIWLQQSSSVELKIGPFVDATDGFTAETGLSIVVADVRLAKNNADWAAKAQATDPVHEENGYYRVLLDTADTDTLGRLAVAISKAGARPVINYYMVVPGTTYLAMIAGSASFNAQVTGMDADVVTASALATNAVSEIADGVWDEARAGHATAGTFGEGVTSTGSIAAGGISSSSFAAGAINAAAIATNAIDADALASDAITEIQAGLEVSTRMAVGTVDSGTTTTMVDSARTESDNDYWAGAWLLITSGSLVGQARLITAFNAATDTMTVSPAFTAALSAAHTYAIYMSAGSQVTSLAAGSITAATFAANAISEPAVASNTLTAAKFATNCITSAKMATDSIGASEISASAANKIADHILRRSFASARTSSDGDAVSFRSLLGAVAKLVNRWRVSGGTLTVYQENDTTALGTQTVTGTAGADPVTEADTV